ncbi:hypothetical protein B7489_05375 [Vibrio alginolyticus]|uniref:hypothetical protein n=2 Tax=Vibrio alginolyticus TaxID=663 RepID=UPI000A1E66F3|nr:hypothetical protein [Vibrio alginolyticus]OSP14089.1 hypothetical protein B7489_05375 [Vibrio alginolyticus]
MRTVLFTDIDDCFMATKRKFSESDSLSIASLDIDGQARSFMSEKQRTLLELFIDTRSTIIPVTGRSYNTLKRVQVSSLFKSWMVVSHGALIIEPNGKKCNAWVEHIKNKFPLGLWSDKLNLINEELKEFILSKGVNAQSYIVSEDDIDCYVCVKCTEGIDYDFIFDSILSQISIDLNDIKIHINGRNMALFPPYTQKKLAVDYIIRQLDEKSLILTMGDSLSDIPFMKLSDFALMPTKSQIADSLSW